MGCDRKNTSFAIRGKRCFCVFLAIRNENLVGIDRSAINKYYEDFATPLWSFNIDVHQKDLNRYQYTMFIAQVPLATQKGLITGELVRYA